MHNNTSSSLKDFEIQTKLGQGSFGIVYKVKRKIDNSHYVMKQINISQMSSRMKQDAINEVTVLSKMSNPYVVKYYDSFIDKNILCIIMEYCDNGDLATYLKSQQGRPLPESKIWQFFILSTLGLEYIHRKKILHRDIKTMNIFLTKQEGNLRIGDLGVAKILSDQDNFAHTMVGTPFYLSPEMCEEKPYNEKSDIWSLGCVLYELCTYKHPFEANNQAALIMRIIRGKYEPINSMYSRELSGMVDMCLCRDYKRRPNAKDLLSTSVIKEKALQLNLELDSSKISLNQQIYVKKAKEEVVIVKKVENNIEENVNQKEKNEQLIKDKNEQKEREKEYLKKVDQKMNELAIQNMQKKEDNNKMLEKQKLEKQKLIQQQIVLQQKANEDKEKREKQKQKYEELQLKKKELEKNQLQEKELQLKKKEQEKIRQEMYQKQLADLKQFQQKQLENAKSNQKLPIKKEIVPLPKQNDAFVLQKPQEIPQKIPVIIQQKPQIKQKTPEVQEQEKPKSQIQKIIQNNQNQINDQLKIIDSSLEDDQKANQKIPKMGIQQQIVNDSFLEKEFGDNSSENEDKIVEKGKHVIKKQLNEWNQDQQIPLTENHQDDFFCVQENEDRKEESYYSQNQENDNYFEEEEQQSSNQQIFDEDDQFQQNCLDNKQENLNDLNKKLNDAIKREYELGTLLLIKHKECNQLFGEEKFKKMHCFFRSKMNSDVELNEKDQNEIDDMIQENVNYINNPQAIYTIYKVLHLEVEVEKTKENIKNIRQSISQNG